MALYAYISIFAIIINFTCCQECVLNPSWPSEVPVEKRLKDEILKDYDTETSPKCNNTKGVEVSLVYVIERLEFDQLEEELTIYAWNVFEWEDDRLKWDLDKHKGIKEVVLHFFDIWSPGIQVKNIKDENEFTFPEIYECSANNTGHVKCLQSNIHSLVCSSEMKDWPYDIKYCNLKIDDETWLQTESNVVFTDIMFVPVDDTYTAWKLVHSKVHLNLTGDHQASIEFVLERMAEGLEAVIVIPAVVISVLTMTSTLMGVKDDTMRLGVMFVSLLSHFLFLTSISKKVPKHSVNAPNILLFISGSMTLTLIVLVMSLLLRYLCSRKYSAPVLITTFNTFVLDGVGQYLVFPRWSVTTNNKTVLDSINQQTEWFDFSNIINSIISIVCVISYIAMYSSYLSHKKYVPTF